MTGSADYECCLSSVPIREYLATRESRRSYVIPSVAGIYIWMRDPTRWMSPRRDASQADVSAVMGGTGRIRSGEVDPYWSVTLREQRKAVPAEKLSTLLDALSSPESDYSNWLIETALIVQRPLYIGYTKNLTERINDHLDQNSRLRSRLKSEDIDISRCAVTWTEYPSDDGLSEKELTAHLKAAESLLIRLAMPLFNERQD